MLERVQQSRQILERGGLGGLGQSCIPVFRAKLTAGYVGERRVDREDDKMLRPGGVDLRPRGLKDPVDRDKSVRGTSNEPRPICTHGIQEYTIDPIASASVASLEVPEQKQSRRREGAERN